MKRHLDKDNALSLLIVAISIIATIFIPYLAGLFSYNHTPLHTQIFGSYEQIKQPAGDYYWITNGAYTSVVGDYWVSGLLFILLIVITGLLAFVIVYSLYLFFDWLFPKNESHVTYTPEKDLEP